MKLRFTGLTGLCVALLLGSVLTADVYAQAKDKKTDAAKVSNVQGTVQMINKDTSTITVRVGSTPRMVAYSANTKFLYGHSDNNKPGTLGQLKEGNYISCVGPFDAKSQIMATTCVYREQK